MPKRSQRSMVRDGDDDDKEQQRSSAARILKNLEQRKRQTEQIRKAKDGFNFDLQKMNTQIKYAQSQVEKMLDTGQKAIDEVFTRIMDEDKKIEELDE